MTKARKAIIKQLSITKTVPKGDESDTNQESSNLPTPKTTDDRDSL